MLIDVFLVFSGIIAALILLGEKKDARLAGVIGSLLILYFGVWINYDGISYVSSQTNSMNETWTFDSVTNVTVVNSSTLIVPVYTAIVSPYTDFTQMISFIFFGSGLYLLVLYAARFYDGGTSAWKR